jgi:DNA-binding response OmpR family regulator
MPDHIAVVADDLIWASRLVAAVQQAGATPIRFGSDAEVEVALEALGLEEPGDAHYYPTGESGASDAEVDEDPEASSGTRLMAAIVDLFGHRYDGVEAVRGFRAAGLPVIAVAQHDDLDVRRTALEAGALRVFSYAKFFQDGPSLVARWLAAPEADAESLPDDPEQQLIDEPPA